MADTVAVAAGKAQQFTETESGLLVELRERLPAALQAGDATPKGPSGTSLWGVELLPPAGPGEHDLRADTILVKFLRARGNDVQQALDMLVKTLQWRAAFGVDELMAETFPEDVFGRVGAVHGCDKEGRPVTYNFYGGLDNKTVFGDLDRFLRWRVQLHERGVRQLDFVDVADMVQVHDYEGVGLLSYDGYARAASKATVQLMADHYPETLAAKIFINVPGWGETIFNLIGRWLSEETKRKFVVASTASTAAALAQRIDADSLPEKFRPAPAVPPQQEQQPPTTTTTTTSDEQEGPTKTDGPAPQSPPQPQPAHLAAADDLLPPTSAADAEAGDPAPAEPAPAAAAQGPDTATAAPAEQPEAAPPAESAGMREDSRTDPATSAAAPPQA